MSNLKGTPGSPNHLSQYLLCTKRISTSTCYSALQKGCRLGKTKTLNLYDKQCNHMDKKDRLWWFDQTSSCWGLQQSSHDQSIDGHCGGAIWLLVDEIVEFLHYATGLELSEQFRQVPCGIHRHVIPGTVAGVVCIVVFGLPVYGDSHVDGRPAGRPVQHSF
jgi:hypothetical protein